MRGRWKRGTGGAQDGRSGPEPAWDQTIPPWEVPGWDDEDSFAPEADEGLPESHPSGPMPAVSSGPLPPLPDDLPPGYYGRHRGMHSLPRSRSPRPSPHPQVPPQAGPRSPVPPQAGPRTPGLWYSDDEAGSHDGYSGTGFPGSGPVGNQGAGEYSRGGAGQYSRGGAGADYHDTGPTGPVYLEEGYRRADTGPTGPVYPEEGHRDSSYGQEAYPPSDSWERGYPADRYPRTDEHPTGGGYVPGPDSEGLGGYSGEEYGSNGGYVTGAGYPGEPGYGTGESLAPDQDAYDSGYQPGGPADGYRDEITDAGYRQPREWYRDVDDNRVWAGEQYSQEGFLPGLSGGDTRQSESRPGLERATDPGRPGRGGAKRDIARAGGKPPRRKRGFHRIAPWLALVVVLVLVGVAGGGYYYVWHTYLHPADYSGEGTGTVTVQIKPGDAAATVGERLQALGVVASARAFDNAAKNSGKSSALEPGFYHLHKHMKASLAFALLLKPSSRVEWKVAIPEGLRLSKIISLLGKATGDLNGYERAVKDVKALDLPAAAHGDPQGYLFPATYQIQPGTSPAQVLHDMVQRFEQEAAAVKLKTAAANGHITESEVIIVASLIQAEGARLEDFPKIAEVIYNRLNDHMRLQLDSTVLFALNRYGSLSTSDLSVKSPYNTYQNDGLPPGPIDTPGDAAIRAALHPDHGDYLFFLTVNSQTGLTKFTDSLAVFNQWKSQYAKTMGGG